MPFACAPMMYWHVKSCFLSWQLCRSNAEIRHSVAYVVRKHGTPPPPNTIVTWNGRRRAWSQRKAIAERTGTSGTTAWRSAERNQVGEAEAAKTEAKAAFVAKVGSLLGSGKMKKLEADNRTLQSEVAARDGSIKLLQQQIERQQGKNIIAMELQAKHRRDCRTKKWRTKRKCHFWNPSSRKPRNGFPLFRVGVYGEVLPCKVGFNERQTAAYQRKASLFYEGELYSENTSGSSTQKGLVSK